MKLDLIDTLALGGLALLAGYALRRLVPVLGRLNVPAPVLGGLLVALAVLAARSRGVTLFEFDTTLQRPLMVAFFTTIGFAASLRLLRAGGPLVLKFFVLASLFAVLQNVVGILLAQLFGLSPLFGVLAGSVTLTGGPATGLAFAPAFEAAGVPAAASVALAVAMGGIVAGGLAGGPVAGALMARHGLQPAAAEPPRVSALHESRRQRRERERAASGSVTAGVPVAPTQVEDESPESLRIVRNVVAILVAMWAGSWISAGIDALGVTLPAYIGAMLAAALLRNLDDLTGWVGLDGRFVNEFGAATLSLFLVVAIMTLRLWELAGLALPLVVMLAVQLALVAAVAYLLVFRWMGRDYDAAVMSGGFVGFMLGTTANAMAVMRAVVERHGPAPTAFLVAPMVGAFFIDFTNALIITAFLNVLG